MKIPAKNFTLINEKKIINKAKPMQKNILFSIVGITVVCLILVIYLITRQNKQVDITADTGNQIIPTIIKPSVSPTSVTIPTRIPTTANNETVIAYVTPKSLPTESTPIISSTSIPTKTSSLPLTGTVENSLIIAVVSGFMIILAFVF